MAEHLTQPDMRTIDTAVISVAGLGTRMRPFTKDNPKFMAPIYEADSAIPNIDYTLVDLLGAQIRHLVFVVNEGGEEIVNRHLGPIDRQDEADLLAQNKFEELEAARRSHAMFEDVKLSFVKQDLTGKYGTAVPVSLARELVGDAESFAIYGGDDFFWHPSGRSELASAIAGWRTSGAESAIIGKPVARVDGPRYGILRQARNGLLERIVEKPPLQDLPKGIDPLANVSRYVIGKEMWEYLERYMSQPSTNNPKGEYYFTDVINAMTANGRGFYLHSAQNPYFDAGTPKSIRQAGYDIDAARAEYTHK